MAQEEIKLVGSFDDQITKKLQKLNKEIANIGRAFEKFNRNLKPVAKQFNRITDASNRFNESLSKQNNLIAQGTRQMRNYQGAAKKMAASMRGIENQRAKAMRTQGMSRAQMRKQQSGRSGRGMPMPMPAAPTRPVRAPRPARAAAPAPIPAPAPAPARRAAPAPRQAAPAPMAAPVARAKPTKAPKALPRALPTKGPAGKSVQGAGAAMGNSFAKSVASSAVGTTIGMMASQAIMGGISKIGGLLKMPFDKFGAAIKERIGDEMDDLKSAGGMFALDMDLTRDSGNQRLFKDFNDSLQFQERINADMAASASNLPGTTSEFVNTNRQLTDTIQMTMEKNREAFIKFGESQGADVSMGGIGAAREAMAQVGQNLTETVMLASAGQQGGLPMHIAIQQMLGAEKGKFKAMTFTNKFRAAFQKNPLLKNFLMRAEEEINKYEAGSVEKLGVIMDVFQRATPEEQISKMRGSIAGLMESVRSGILDPQGGLFGLSRAVQEFDEAGNVIGPMMKKNVDIMGNTLYEITNVEGLIDRDTGEQVKKGATYTAEQLDLMGLKITEAGDVIRKQGGGSVGKLSQSGTYLFEQLRNFGANYGAVLTQIVGLLPTIFDPFARMTKELIPLTEKSQELFRVFRVANKALDDDVAKMRASSDNATKGLGSKLSKQVMQRSALFSMTDFLQGVGAVDNKEAEEIKAQLVGAKSKTADAINEFPQTAAKIFKQIFERLLNSSIVSDIAQVIGTTFGGIMRTVFDLVNGTVTSFVDAGPMAKVMEGFAKGFDSQFKDMGGFDKFLEKVNALVMRVVDQIGKFLITKVIPFAIQSLIQLIIGGFKAGPIGMLVSGGLILALITGVKAVTKAAISAATSLQMAAKAAARFAATSTMGKKGLPGGRTGLGGNSTAANAGLKIRELFTGTGFKSVGKMAKAGGIGALISAGGTLASGGSAGEAVASGTFTAMGSAIGMAMAGPLGAVLGGYLGDTIGSSEAGKIAGAELTEAFNEIGRQFSEIGGAIYDAFAPIGEVVNPFISSLGIVEGEMNGLAAGVIAIKVVLTPIVALLQLFVFSIKAVGLAFVSFGAAIDKLIAGLIGSLANIEVFGQKPFAGLQETADFFSERSKKGFDDASRIQSSIAKDFKNNMKWYQTNMSKHAKATQMSAEQMSKLSEAAKAAGSTFENNKKFKGADGKDYGWAMKDNQKILVEWGSLKGTGLEEASKSLQEAADALKSPVENGKVEVGKGMDQATADQINALRAGRLSPESSVSKAPAKAAAAIPATPTTPAAPATPAAAPAPAAPELPDLSAPIAQVGEAATGVANATSAVTEATTGMATATTAVTEVGTVMQTLAAPMGEVAEAATAAAPPITEIGPAADSANTALDTFSSAIQAVPPLVEAALVGAATTAGDAISTAAQGLAQALSNAASSIKNAASASASAKASGATGGNSYSGHTGGRGTKQMPLAAAIEKERQMMPSGSDLLIANTSETVIPAFAGHKGDGFKNLSFDEMEGAAGFNRMKTYTDQIAEIADKTAAEFSGGFGGALGGGSATLNAMEALGHSFGLTTTSGFRPGDPGFHGVNRARDLSNGGGETPEMNAAAAKMASEFGSSLTELIYTPMGFSIKNGAKTGLISPDNHYHHIHVAVAEGLAKAAVFQSEKAALAYEKANMPVGSEPMKVDLSSMTANSSEIAGGGDQSVTMGDINVTVSGVEDPKAIANEVAGEILHAIEKATYTELFTS